MNRAGDGSRCLLPLPFHKATPPDDTKADAQQALHQWPTLLFPDQKAQFFAKRIHPIPSSRLMVSSGKRVWLAISGWVRPEKTASSIMFR